jgi:flavin-dependent dehydrogenase
MKVIIIGAGTSGLTFAAALAQLASQHEVELYERDRSAGARRKGYVISLKGDAGLGPVLRPAGVGQCCNPGVPRSSSTSQVGFRS